MTTVVIQQPSYLPWLGYFEQINQADVFVFYDDVQYTKNDWRNRNRIKTKNGEQWITVPVNYKTGQKICDVKIDNTRDWKKKHLRSILTSYAKTRNFKEYIKYFRELYATDWLNMCDLAEYTVIMLSNLLNIKTEFKRSKEMSVKGGKTECLVNICMSLGADRYYSPKKSIAYLDISQFEKAGIKVEFQDYLHPVYPQLHGEFIPYMSVIDLLFNCGTISLDVIKNGSKGRFCKI